MARLLAVNVGLSRDIELPTLAHSPQKLRFVKLRFDAKRCDLARKRTTAGMGSFALPFAFLLLPAGPIITSIFVSFFSLLLRAPR